MNILFVTNSVKKYALVYKNVIDIMIANGNNVIWAGNFDNCVEKDSIPCAIENIPIQSNPLKRNNKIALNALKQIIKERDINCVYCSTPIGSTLARLAAKKYQNIKVIYAAHGFLFFKKSKKWYLNPLFKIHEKVLAKYTDCLITITQEDFDYAKKHLRLRNNGNIYLVNGAGIELSEKPFIDVNKKRKELGLNCDDYVLISAGFLNKNKNNIVIIKALHRLNNHKIKYLVCGEGNELSSLKRAVSKYKLENNVLFLGYRQDMNELFCISNLFIMPSFREGAPRSLLEAMNCDVPCIGSNVRGVSDLIGNKATFKLLCRPNNPRDFAESINSAINFDFSEIIMANRNIVKKYSKEVVVSQLNCVLSKEL